MGTHDVSILEFGSGVFEVLSTNGDTHLGGDDFDHVIIDWLADEFKGDTGVDLRKDPMAMQRLKEAAEKAKIELSSSTQTEINLPYITVVDGVPQHLVKTFNRAKFEALADSLIKRTIAPCAQALKDAELTVNDIDEIILVGGSTRIPAIQNAVKEFFGKEPSKAVNPDEAVAMGAAIQGAVLAGDSSVGDVVLLDVTPISLGIETNGNTMTKLIEANSTIPCKKTETFTTAVDNQPAVSIVVLQGERVMSKDNKVIGTFNLDGIAPAPAHVPQIEVTFDIDANGVLSVSAKDKGTGKEQHITIQNQNLSDDEIAKIKADAEKYAEEDKKKKEEIDKLNAAQGYAFAVEKSLDENEMGGKMTEDEKTSIKEKLDTLKAAVEAKNLADVETAQKSLEEVYTPIITKIYQESNPQTGAQVPPTGDGANPFAGANGSANPFMDGMADMFNGATNK